MQERRSRALLASSDQPLNLGVLGGSVGRPAYNKGKSLYYPRPLDLGLDRAPVEFLTFGFLRRPIIYP